MNVLNFPTNEFKQKLLEREFLADTIFELERLRRSIDFVHNDLLAAGIETDGIEEQGRALESRIDSWRECLRLAAEEGFDAEGRH